MATSAPMRRALIDQIPTEEDRQAPAARPQSGIHSSELGRQAFNTAMALPGVGGIGKAAQTGGLVSRALNSTAGVAAKGAVPYVAPGTGLAAVSAASESERPTSVQRMATNSAGAGSGTVNPPTAGASSPLVEASRQVAPGIYRAGNSYAGTSDAAVSLDREPKGPPSAQNMAAADQLAANQQMESISRVATSGNVPQSPSQGLIGRVTATHSGNDWTAREMLRRQKTNADSLIHQSHWAPKGSARAAQASYQNAAVEDMAAMTRGQTSADVEVMRQNAGLMGEQMRQTGADRRDARRGLIDAARLGMDQETQGVATRAAAQQEQLRSTLLDPNASTEQRALAQRSLAALAGKTAADRLQTVNLPDTTTDMGAVVRGGQALVRIMEDGTAQQVPVGAQAAQPLTNHVQALRKDPKLAAQFDAQYGPGASARYLGK